MHISKLSGTLISVSQPPSIKIIGVCAPQIPKIGAVAKGLIIIFTSLRCFLNTSLQLEIRQFYIFYRVCPCMYFNLNFLAEPPLLYCLCILLLLLYTDCYITSTLSLICMSTLRFSFRYFCYLIVCSCHPLHFVCLFLIFSYSCSSHVYFQRLIVRKWIFNLHISHIKLIN